ncbi:MAG: right-handed parallel beta-helix repeat-containing protein [Actinomycetota bacterium]|nr:right-handed parallel beta-helix repeat-containing protein [Actinomycetota bacterium]
MAVVLCPFVATSGPSATATSTSSTAATAQPTTFHVATNGRDSASGTPSSPLRTLGAAIRRARSGDRIVVHRGSYHEEIEIPEGKRLSIRSAPGARVWLEGSRRVTSWRGEGGLYVHTGWRAEFDSSPTYSWGQPDNEEEGWEFVNRRHPMAAHPDQVWIGGRAQRQVATRRDVRPGTFFVDEAGDRLYLGSDPRGKSVRASDIAKAVSIRGAGSSVSGLGVRRFAPSVPHMGAVTVEAPDVSLSDMRIDRNATTGLHVMKSDVTLTNLKLTRNGMLGASATYADGLRAIGLRVRRNNTERFNFSPVAGGIKVGRTRGVLVRNSEFSHNAGTGLWLDESSYAVTVLSSTMRDNLHHGLSLEISARAVVADTVIAGNADDGIKINDTSDVSVWNNTIVGNGRPVNIVQDDRDPSDLSTPGHDPRQPRPDPTMTWINGPVQVHNNILSASRAGNCLLCVEDFSERFSAEEMRIHASGNVYQRRDRSSPTWAVVWSRGSGDPEVFTSVRAFHAATGEEPRHADLVGVPAVTSSLRATHHVTTRTGEVAGRLPRQLALLLGRLPGTRHLGAWFD